MMERRVRVNDGLGASKRSVPIEHARITATSIGTAQIVYTAQPDVIVRLMRFSVANTTGTDATVTVHSVPPDGSAAVDNTEIPAVNVPANTVADLTDFFGGLYVAGTTLRAFSGTASALVVHGWVEEIL